MIISIIVALVIFAYSIYQTSQYNKLEDKYDLLKLKFVDQCKESWDFHQAALNKDLDLYALNYKALNDEIERLNELLKESKTPITIEPIITVNDATEVIKSKRGRKKIQ